jgi:hypothetical protein
VRPASEAFHRASRGSHRAFSRAKVVTSYQEGTQPTGTEIAIFNGEATADAQANIRGRLNLTTDGTRMFPEGPEGLLTPYGNELFVERGIAFGGGSIEVISLGYYRIYEVEQEDVPNGPIRVMALDRMSGIVDARLEAPQQFTAGTSIEDVVTALVHEVYPGATILFDFNAATTLLQSNQVADQDRYAFLRDIAQSRGKVMYWDYAGRLRIEDPPSPSEPVMEINYGRDGILVAMKRLLSRDGVYNAVVASGERPASDIEPVRAVAKDMNPDSPTYWLGAFGKVPRFYSSPLITDGAQAASAAEKLLARALGLPYSASLTAVPCVALEVLDPVAVTYSGRGRREIHILETVSIPLDVETPMTATTREQSVLTIGLE